MTIKKAKLLYIMLIGFIIFVSIIPKINIINFPSSSTGIRTDDILIAILLMILLPNIREMMSKDKNIKKLTKLFALYLAICIISIIYGTASGYIDIFLGILHFMRKVEYFIVIFLGYVYFHFEKKEPIFMKIMNFAVIFHFIFSILQYFNLVGAFYSGGIVSGLIAKYRASSTFNGAYEMSAFLLLLLPMYLNKILKNEKQNSILKNRKHFIINLLFIILIFICILLSQSRISLIIFVIISILMLYRSFEKKKKNKVLIMSILVVSIILGLFIVKFGNVKISDRLNDISINDSINSTLCAWKYKDFDLYVSEKAWYVNYDCILIGKDYSWNWRVSHWIQLIDGMLRNPLFGVGVSIAGSAADGEYIRVLAESGIMGLILWLNIIMVIITVFRKQKDNPYCQICKYAIYSMLFGALFIDVFSSSKVSMMLWFMVGITYASISNQNNKKSKKVKNIIIVNDFDYVQGGASKVALHTAEVLKKKYNVIFFSAVSSHSDKNKNITFISTNQKEALKEKNKWKGMLNGIYNIKAKKEFSKLLNDYSPSDTIIHVHGWTKALSSSIFVPAFENNFKVVLTLHDYFTACPNGGYYNYSMNRVCRLDPLSPKCVFSDCDSRNYFFKLYRIIRQFVQYKIVKLNKNLDYAIGISDLSVDILSKSLPSAEIVKIYNPIKLNLDYAFSCDNDYYLYLGRVSKEKGVEMFAKTLSKIKKKAIVVGDGDELERLKNKYPSIEFVGWKNKEEVNHYLKNARALIVPSLWYEGAPLTPLEAMSFGVPCIISNVCAGREYITNNGLLFDPYDEKDLIQKIKLLEQDIMNYSINSYQYVQNFDPKNYVKKLSNFYEHILNQKH